MTRSCPGSVGKRNERAVGAHSVAMAAPAHDTDEEAREMDAEREKVAERTETARLRSQAERAIDLDLQHEPARDRGDDHQSTRERSRRRERAEDRERQRMRHDETRVTPGTRRAQRTRPPQLVAQQ